jgi:hypothetical protein
VLVQTWEEDEEIVIQWLLHNDAFNMEGLNDQLLDEHVEQVKAFCGTRSNHLKATRLCEHVMEKKQKYGDDFRCIVFVQQQITAYVLGQLFLNNSCQRTDEHSIKAGYGVSRGSKITPSIKFNKTMAATL